MSAANAPIVVFPEWRDKPLDAALYECRELVEDTEFPTVQRWRAAGGKVVGHFQVYFPEEIVHAAGAAALQGARRADRADAGRLALRLLSLLDPQDLARPGALQAHRARPLRHAIRSATPPATWRPSGAATSPTRPRSSTCRRTPTRRTPPTYLRGEYDRLRRSVEAVAGGEVTDADSAPLDRRLQREPRPAARALPPQARDAVAGLRRRGLRARRARRPAAARRAQRAPALRAAARSRQRPATQQDKIRVVLEGGFCEQPPLDLMRVDRPLLLRRRRRPADRPALDDERRAGRRRSAAAVWPTAYLEQLELQPGAARPAQAQGAHAARAHPQRRAPTPRSSWPPRCASPASRSRSPTPRRSTDAGIPYFVSEFEENMTSFDHLEIQLETFVENLLFR